MPGIDHRAIDESPLIKELAEIGKGEKPLPKTEAKRHHFIPQLTLNRFTGKEDRLYQLDTGTGKPQRTNVHGAASRRRFHVRRCGRQQEQRRRGVLLAGRVTRCAGAPSHG